MKTNTQVSQTEFFSPFAHIPDQYEWCCIHSPSHGSFNTFIVILEATDKPVIVYVDSDAGTAFMAERYPESQCFLVPKGDLTITSSEEGRCVKGSLRANIGPISKADMVFKASIDAPLTESSYGASDFAVWGSRWSCEGVDMEVEASVSGDIIRDGAKETYQTTGIITLGSYGKIEPLKK